MSIAAPGHEKHVQYANPEIEVLPLENIKINTT